jgi:hypothetical protein
MDEEALTRELQGIASSELVYVVRDGGQEVVGLSKTGVDECCMALVAQGQVIREESVEYEILGEGEDREALFKVKAARFAVSANGQEVRLDQVLGVKRQPLYHEPQVLDLDSRVPSKKYRGKTYRELLDSEEGRDYLTWMAENFNEEEIRAFVRRILDGEETMAQRGKQFNNHWYEAGAMKACRNARFRLIPSHVRAQIIATARQAGAGSGEHQASRRVQPTVIGGIGHGEPVAERGDADEGQQARSASPDAPTDKQVSFYRNLAESPVWTVEERNRNLQWLTTATRQTIKDAIDHLKRTVEARKAGQA